MPRQSDILASKPRGALAERTNIQTSPADASSAIKSWLAPPKRAQCKRPLSIDEGGDRKRVKLSSDENYSSGASDDAYESDSDQEIQNAGPCHRRNINLASKRLPVASSRRPFCASLVFSIFRVLLMAVSPVSTLPILQSFVSSNKSDVFRCHSVLDGSYLAPPYACSYSHCQFSRIS